MSDGTIEEIKARLNIVELIGTYVRLESLADSFAGTIGTLPDGETAPAGADILVIVGNK